MQFKEENLTLEMREYSSNKMLKVINRKTAGPDSCLIIFKRQTNCINFIRLNPYKRHKTWD